MEVSVLHTLSTPLTKALQAGNSVAQTFQQLLLSRDEPLQTVADGIWPASLTGQGGAFVPNRLFLMPYAAGAVGAQFSMRLYGWRMIGVDVFDSWIPILLAELLCTIGNLPGPCKAPTDGPLLQSELLCDDMSLTSGSVGNFGELVTFGAGSSVPAFAAIDLRGCQKWSFDFMGDGNVAMNCLWARA